MSGEKRPLWNILEEACSGQREQQLPGPRGWRGLEGQGDSQVACEKTMARPAAEDLGTSEGRWGSF